MCSLKLKLPRVLHTMNFLLIHAYAIMVSVTSQSLLESHQTEEYAALVDFYQSTNGDNWNDNSGWDFINKTNSNITMKEICTDYQPYGLTCNITSEYHITQLYFYYNNLDGTLPDSIVNLSHLNSIQFLYEMNLIGYFPVSTFNISSITQFRNLHTKMAIVIDNNLCQWKYLSIFQDYPYHEKQNVSYGFIPSCICNMTNLVVLDIGNYYADIAFVSTDSIPECLFSTVSLEYLCLRAFNYTNGEQDYPMLPDTTYLPKLYSFCIPRMNFIGTIPESFCSIGTNLSATIEHISFINMARNSLNGTIPSCIFEKMFDPGISYEINLEQNQFSGSIDDLDMINDKFNNDFSCEIEIFGINSNLISGTIPQWLTRCNYTFSFIISENLFKGSLPSNWNTRFFSVSSNKLEGTIPHDLISNTFDGLLHFFDCRNNDLSGSIPRMLIESNPQLTFLFVDDNNFEYFPFDSLYVLSNLTVLSMSNNKIFTENVATALNDIFLHHANTLQVLLLHQNELSGRLDSWEIATFGSQCVNLDVLTLHDNNIYGKISTNNFNFPSIEYFTLFNNRLSCQLPNSIVAIDHNTSYNEANINSSLKLGIAILGNLFSVIEDHSNSHSSNNTWRLIDASNLYLTWIDLLTYEIYLIAASICIVFLVVFLYNVAPITNCLSIVSIFIGLLAVILSFVYYYESSYYECGRTTSHFSLIYFTSNNVYVEILVSILITMMQFVYLYILYAVVMKSHNGFFSDKLTFEFIKDEINVDKPPNSKCGVTWIFWIFLYIIGIILSAIYIIYDYLPPQSSYNGIGLSTTSVNLIFYGLALILTLVNIYVVPKIVDSCMCQSRVLSIAILRSFLSCIIPFIVSILFLDNCFRLWPLLWTQCMQNNNSRNDFDITYSQSYSGYVTTVTYNVGWSLAADYTLLTKDVVCHTNSMDDIDINACLRNFFDIWVPLIATKLFITSINPWFMVFVKQYIRQKMESITCSLHVNWCQRDKYKCKCCRSTKESTSIRNLSEDWGSYYDSVEMSSGSQIVLKTNIKDKLVNKLKTCNFDTQFAVMITKLDICFIFGLISPFLLFIALTSMISNYICFLKIYKQYKWKINDTTTSHEFPIKFLFGSIVIQQIILFIFCWHLFTNQIMLFFLPVSFIVSDVFFIVCTATHFGLTKCPSV